MPQRARICDSVKLWSSAEFILTWHRRTSTWSPIKIFELLGNKSEQMMDGFQTHCQTSYTFQNQNLCNKTCKQIYECLRLATIKQKIQQRKELAQLLFNIHMPQTNLWSRRKRRWTLCWLIWERKQTIKHRCKLLRSQANMNIHKSNHTKHGEHQLDV